MVRSCAFVVGVCLSVAGVARAESPAEQARLDTAKQAEFDSFVAMGKRAQLVGRYEEAATAYRAALDILPHPVIAGRYGLVLMKLGHLDKAAEELHEAHERGQGVTLQERREVGAAYDKAKALTTWVNVNVTQMGANVTCDGEPWSREGFSSFWRFAMPGEHVLRAKLDGYEEAVETFTAKPGDEITVSLKLVPLAGPKLPELPAPAAVALPDTRVFPPLLRTTNIADDPNYDPKEDPSYGEPKEPKPEKKKTGPRFSISGGVVTVFGVASWNPAVGGVVGVGLRPNDYFSLGLEGRAAWLTTQVASQPINAMTAGGLFSLCGHIKWFFACPLGHVGVIRTEGAKSTFSEAPFNIFRPGFGGRLGVRFRPTERLSLQAAAEALALTNRTRIFIGNQIIVDQPAAMIGTQITGDWEF
jgi:hypothetical protein